MLLVMKEGAGIKKAPWKNHNAMFLTVLGNVCHWVVIRVSIESNLIDIVPFIYD